jgi:hypothetical protein
MQFKARALVISKITAKQLNRIIVLSQLPAMPGLIFQALLHRTHYCMRDKRYIHVRYVYVCVNHLAF